MAKKEISGVAEFLLNLVLPLFLSFGGAEFAKLLQKAFDDNNEFVRTMSVSLYPFIDVYLETAAAKSKTKIDDKIVAEFKTAIENFAAANGIELPNLDDD